MLKLNALSGALAISFVVGCGGAAKVPPSTPATAARGGPPKTAPAQVVAPGASIPDEEANDLTPIAAPGPRVLHIRWANPRDTIITAAGFGTAPRGALDRVMTFATREFARNWFDGSVDTRALSETIDLSAPIDVVTVSVHGPNSREPQPITVLSVGISSLQRARATSQGRARKLSPGVWRIGDEKTFGDACVLAASAGTTPARLVCGDNQREALTMARYMATTVALEPSASDDDINVDITLRPLLDQYGGDIKKAAADLRHQAASLAREFPSLKARSQRIVDALADELLAVTADADVFSFRLDVDTQSGMHALAKVRYASKQSWTVNSLTDVPSSSAGAPDIFWSLPATSTAAGYGHSVDPARYDEVLSVLRDGIGDLLIKKKTGSPADRAALLKLLRLPVSKHVAVASASGHFAAGTSSGTSTSSVRAVLGATLGWYVYGVDEGPGKLKSYLNEIVRTYNRPAFQKMAKKALRYDSKRMPQARVVAAPASLGRHRMAVELVVPNIEDLQLGGRPKRHAGGSHKTTTIKVYLLLSSDGKRTWLGSSLQRDPLAKLMAGLRRGSAAGLGSRTDLQPLRTQPHVGASFTNMRGIADAVLPLTKLALEAGPGPSSRAGQRILAAFGAMPHNGKTLIRSFVDIDAGSGTTTVEMNMPRQSLEDLGFLVSEAVAALSNR